jgi:hypothetical protein
MNSGNHSAAQGLWAVSWRAMVYLPLMLASFGFFLAHFAGLLVLPWVALTSIYCGLWRQAVGAAGCWLIIVWSWRRFRLSENLKDPPSLL